MDKFWYLTLGLLIGWIIHWIISSLFCKCKCTNENCLKHGNGGGLGKGSTSSNMGATSSGATGSAGYNASRTASVQGTAETVTASTTKSAQGFLDTASQSASHAASAATSGVAATAAFAAAKVPSGLFQTKDGKDDLQVIEGIGPKICELLNNAGVNYFHELAETPVARIKEILAAGGSRFAIARPDTWPEQAALIAKGDKAGFEKLTQELKGGVRT